MLKFPLPPDVTSAVTDHVPPTPAVVAFEFTIAPRLLAE
jgi:hypothetical protein